MCLEENKETKSLRYKRENQMTLTRSAESLEYGDADE